MLSQPAGNHCLTIVAVLILVTGCSGQATRATTAAARAVTTTPVPARPGAKARRTVGEHAAVTAMGQVGVPYRFGGSTTSGFDCSGLVNYAYAKAGTVMPRTTSALWRELRPVAVDDLQVGDVLFFDIEGKVSHVGLYLGDSRFVHAPASGKTVTVASLKADFYRRALIRGGRPR